MNLTNFIRDYDAFTQIDDAEFDALIAVCGRKLAAVNHEVFLSAEGPSIREGSLELRFDDDHVINLTNGHVGARVYVGEIYADPGHPDVPTEVRTLPGMESAIGNSCDDVIVGLEQANVSGSEFLIAAFVFDFGSIKVGYENFMESWDKKRSQIVINPRWCNCGLVSLTTGKRLK